MYVTYVILYDTKNAIVENNTVANDKQTETRAINRCVRIRVTGRIVDRFGIVAW